MVYRYESWSNWFIGSPCQTLVNVENNSIESYNRVIKNDAPDVITLQYFFENKIYSILSTAASKVENWKNSRSYQMLSQEYLIDECNIPDEVIRKSIILNDTPGAFVHSLEHEKYFFNRSHDLNVHIAQYGIENYLSCHSNSQLS